MYGNLESDLIFSLFDENIVEPATIGQHWIDESASFFIAAK